VWLWFATIAGILVLLAADLVIVDHNPHTIRVAEAARWVAFYVTCAVLFGLGILAFFGGQYAGEFFAGYITEYSLSVDNLFVFVIIMTTFGVPAIHQHRVLLFGILAAMVLRGLFIAAGAAVIERFEWVFFVFGAFLLYTGYRLAFRGESDEEEFKENAALRVVRRFLPVTDDYHGASVFTRIGGKRFVTPMLVVMLAIGTTDLLFALDSIPAIFGLTKEPFLVFSSNAFALMGLRQLYFLLGGLLNRLVYLDTGLAVILGFIGVKLILEALHGQGVSWAPEIGIVTSLVVIVLVLGITTVLSLLKVRRDPSAAKHLPTARSGAAAAGSGPGTGDERRPTHGATAATHGATAATHSAPAATHGATHGGTAETHGATAAPHGAPAATQGATHGGTAETHGATAAAHGAPAGSQGGTAGSQGGTAGSQGGTAGSQGGTAGSQGGIAGDRRPNGTVHQPDRPPDARVPVHGATRADLPADGPG
jgi:tellurite resistance protein TerC